LNNAGDVPTFSSIVNLIKNTAMSEELVTTPPGLFPLLPLRDVVVFPHMVIPLFVGRAKSIKALESAMEAGKSIVLVAQKSAAKDERQYPADAETA
jgi:ATP-dependent Lon protease